MGETLNLEPSYQLAEDLNMGQSAGVRAGVVVISLLALAELELLGRVLLEEASLRAAVLIVMPVGEEERGQLVRMPAHLLV